MSGNISQARVRRALIALLAVCLNIVLATVALMPTHGHTQARPCEVCQVAHLPFLAPSVTIAVKQVAPVVWEQAAATPADPSESERVPTGSRAPPFWL